MLSVWVRGAVDRVIAVPVVEKREPVLEVRQVFAEVLGELVDVLRRKLAVSIERIKRRANCWP